ncbi:MAG: hypothetical protein IIY21_05055 [Clostridiales bacterium]|jgi:hypothetical protein|nr:hypothetical protein [Clostridiales bacterium]MBQ1571208.1 hypothetical protein [Clostridiales bacterium]
MIIKQLASFAVLNVNGGYRVTYTYDEINADTGDLISSNNKGSFYAVDKDLKNEIEAIREYIIDNKLSEE